MLLSLLLALGQAAPPPVTITITKEPTAFMVTARPDAAHTVRAIALELGPRPTRTERLPKRGRRATFPIPPGPVTVRVTLDDGSVHLVDVDFPPQPRLVRPYKGDPPRLRPDGAQIFPHGTVSRNG